MASLVTTTLLSSITVPLSGSVYTEALSLAGAQGYVSCCFVLTGGGTASLIYELSNDSINWSQVTTLSSLLTGFTVTSGPASDGKTFLYFNPPVAAWLRFKLTETGGANPVVVTLVAGVL